MFTELLVSLSNESLEQIDAAIETVHPALTDRQQFVEQAVEYALASLHEESEMLMLALDDE